MKGRHARFIAAPEKGSQAKGNVPIRGAGNPRGSPVAAAAGGKKSKAKRKKKTKTITRY